MSNSFENLSPEERRLYEMLLAEKQRHKGATIPQTRSGEAVPNLMPVSSQPAPSVDCLHHLFEQQAAQTPDAIALVCEGQQLSYGELNRRANQFAHYLRERGVRPDTMVAMCLHRSAYLVVAMMGILKSGGAYVPLDPAYPEGRLELMMEDSGAPLLVTEKFFFSKMKASTESIICIDELTDELTKRSTANPELVTDHENLAYVIYTSGSTGKPKGVMISHAALANYINWAARAYMGDGQESFGLHSSPAVDLTVTSIFVPLVSGNRIVIYQNDDVADLIRKILRDNRVQLLKLTPTHLTLLAEALTGLDTRASKLRKIIVGGEDLKTSLAASINTAFGGRVQIFNEYGPTEGTVGCTIHQYDPEADLAHSVPIGTAIDNTAVFLLNQYGKPVPQGAAGELYLGGTGVGRGYLNRPELTAERFVPDPFSGESGGRLYRTGDLVRYLANGEIDFLGRVDRQVKIRGFRIELGEIEAVLGRFPGIRQAVVNVREDTPGDKRLVAYVVREEDSPPELDQLQSFAKEKLPAYMVPARLVLMKALPLTSGGKVDYKALPSPDSQAQPTNADFVAPRSELEKQIAAIWQKVLRLEKVGVHDNFFDLGGHSILMVQVFDELREVVRREMAMVELFEHPTINSLARHLTREQGALSGATVETQSAQVEKQREGKDRLRQQFRQRQR
jgi:amino acid adenylation domain-containing protein